MPKTFHLLLLTAIASAGACTKTAVDGRGSGEWIVPTGTTALHITLEKGSVSVLASDDGMVRWEAATRAVTTDGADLAELVAISLVLTNEGVRDGALQLRGPQVPAALAARDPGAALIMKLVVRAPPSLALEVRTTRGSIGVDGWTAPLDIRTDSGDIRLAGVSGASRTFTGNGVHTVTGHRGGLDMETPHGDFLVYIDDLSAPIRLATEAGSVQCNLPPGKGFELMSVTDVGAIETSYPIERVAEGARGERCSGIVDGGGPRVELRAHFGNISLRARSRGS
jgi:hypothetical protein